MSLNQWIAVAVAEKVGVVETAADFFRKRAGKAMGDKLMTFLRQAPKTPPTRRRNPVTGMVRRNVLAKDRSWFAGLLTS